MVLGDFDIEIDITEMRHFLQLKRTKIFLFSEMDGRNHESCRFHPGAGNTLVPTVGFQLSLKGQWEGRIQFSEEPCKCHWFKEMVAKDSSRAGNMSDSPFYPCSAKNG